MLSVLYSYLNTICNEALLQGRETQYRGVVRNGTIAQNNISAFVMSIVIKIITCLDFAIKYPTLSCVVITDTKAVQTTNIVGIIFHALYKGTVG